MLVSDWLEMSCRHVGEHWEECLGVMQSVDVYHGTKRVTAVLRQRQGPDNISTWGHLEPG